MAVGCSPGLLAEQPRQFAAPTAAAVSERFALGKAPRHCYTTVRSPVAQSVEQAAVNRWVAGSSPARGAKFLRYLDGSRSKLKYETVRHLYAPTRPCLASAPVERGKISRGRQPGNPVSATISAATASSGCRSTAARATAGTRGRSRSPASWRDREAARCPPLQAAVPRFAPHAGRVGTARSSTTTIAPAPDRAPGSTCRAWRGSAARGAPMSRDRASARSKQLNRVCGQRFVGLRQQGATRRHPRLGQRGTQLGEDQFRGPGLPNRALI